MTIKYIDNARITYTNDEVDIDFSECVSVAVDNKVTFEGSFDRRSGIVTPTRSANIYDPISITIVLDAPCGQSTGTTVIDDLHRMFVKQINNKEPFKGTIKIVDKQTGEIRTYDQAYLVSDPEYKDRTIERGGTGATYNVEFLCGQEVLN